MQLEAIAEVEIGNKKETNMYKLSDFKVGEKAYSHCDNDLSLDQLRIDTEKPVKKNSRYLYYEKEGDWLNRSSNTMS